MVFGKKKVAKKDIKEKVVPSHMKKAEEISKLYGNIKSCCSILESLSGPNHSYLYSGGWRIWTHTLENAGIDMEDIYKHIGDVVEKKKRYFECKLLEIECK